jgi:hypothetical protein
VNTDRSYWSQYLTHIYHVLNFSKQDPNDTISTSSRDTNKIKDISTSSTQSRNFSTGRELKNYVTLVGLPFDIVYEILIAEPVYCPDL